MRVEIARSIAERLQVSFEGREPVTPGHARYPEGSPSAPSQGGVRRARGRPGAANDGAVPWCLEEGGVVDQPGRAPPDWGSEDVTITKPIDGIANCMAVVLGRKPITGLIQ